MPSCWRRPVRRLRGKRCWIWLRGRGRVAVPGARVPGVRLAGLEVQPQYADLARRNAARNGMEIEVVEGDLAHLPRTLRRDFDHVIANPPWYPSGGTPSPLAPRARALHISLPLSLWVQVAARRLAPGGWLTLIAGADSLPEVLGALAPKLGSAMVLPLAPRAGKAALRVILRARKGAGRHSGCWRPLSSTRARRMTETAKAIPTLPMPSAGWCRPAGGIQLIVRISCRRRAEYG